MLLPFHDNTLVEVDKPVGEDSPGEADNLVVKAGSLEEKGNFVEVYTLVEVDKPVGGDILVVVHIPVAEEGNLVLMHIPVMDILELAFVHQACQIVAVHLARVLPYYPLLVVVQAKVVLLVAAQVVVLLLVVRSAVPDCS